MCNSNQATFNTAVFCHVNVNVTVTVTVNVTLTCASYHENGTDASLCFVTSFALVGCFVNRDFHDLKHMHII